MSSTIERELKRRLGIWHELKTHGGPDGVEAGLVKKLRIHRGQQGIFRDLGSTAAVSGSPAGITVGILHTGRSYADDLAEDGVVYHYPETSRGERDAFEIAATKACSENGLPLFVVITPPENPQRRNVRLGWVKDYDDESKQILIVFSESINPPLSLPAQVDLGSFTLKVGRAYRHSKVRARPNQSRFRFEVVKRYGVQCAVCNIDCQELLQAAHICPVEEGGCDDPRNGLVFCLTHHCAFDKGLFGICPDNFEVQVNPRFQAADLAITKRSIAHLRQFPHREALEWAWSSRYSKFPR